MASDRTEPERPLRVLVADDDFLVATGVVQTLKTIGFEAIGPYASGEEVLRHAPADAPDIALLDIRMPGFDGLAVAEALWERHQIPTVILSAFSDDDYIERARRTGVFGYLVKPVSEDGLKSAIQIAHARAAGSSCLRERVEELELTLAQRRVIEDAKWKLVQTLGIAEPEAHRRIQTHARSTRSTMIDIARAIVESKDVPDALRKA